MVSSRDVVIQTTTNNSSEDIELCTFYIDIEKYVLINHDYISSMCDFTGMDHEIDVGEIGLMFFLWQLSSIRDHIKFLVRWRSLGRVFFYDEFR